MKLRMFSPLLLAGLASLAPLTAQTSTLRVNIPFAFAAGDHQYPAGQYDLKYQAPARMVLLTSLNAGAGAHLLPQGFAPALEAGPGSSLVFHKYGDEYCLRGVSFGDGVTSFGFGPTKAEQTRLKRTRFEVAVFKSKAR